MIWLYGLTGACRPKTPSRTTMSVPLRLPTNKCWTDLMRRLLVRPATDTPKIARSHRLKMWLPPQPVNQSHRPPGPPPPRHDTQPTPPQKNIRLRHPEHRKFVAQQPCLVCGRTPVDAHHLRFAQPRAMGRKVSDEFTVPVCRVHHRELHRHGDEAAWWEGNKIDPLPIAHRLWQHARLNGAAATVNGG